METRESPQRVGTEQRPRFDDNPVGRGNATGKRAVPIPEPLYSSALGRFGFPYLPPTAVAHVKYPIVIDNTAFVEATGFTPRSTDKKTMESFRWN